MEVLYITVPSFFDLEISLIRELQKYCKVKILIFVTPVSMHSSAFDIDNLGEKVCIYKASKMEQMEKYDNLIDRKSWYIAINPSGKLYDSFRLDQLVKQFIKENNFKFIHLTTFGNKSTLFLYHTLKKWKNKLLTIHDVIPHSKKSFLRNKISSLYINSFENILTLSESQSTKIKELYPNKNIFTSRLGIYDFLHYYSIKKNKYGKYILFFGRIDIYKGVDILIRAFLESSLPLKGYKLVIAGNGNIDFSKDKNIIEINRYIPNNELATLIHHSEYVVLPYRTVTQSGVLMSAFAFNKFVVASKTGDFINEISPQTGILTKVGDTKELKKALETATVVNKSISKLYIEEHYLNIGDKSWNTIAKKLYNTYIQIINQNNN